MKPGEMAVECSDDGSINRTRRTFVHFNPSQANLAHFISNYQ